MHARRKQPLDDVTWVDPLDLTANDYNPNHVFGPERELLKLSILTDGWTQPIVVTSFMEIVDGFHRWTIAKENPDVAKMTNGRVPVVVIDGEDIHERVAATVRHNRARGQHAIKRMSSLVRKLQGEGLSEAQVCRALGMTHEEFARLSDVRESPELEGKDSFGKGWVPDPKGDVGNGL